MASEQEVLAAFRELQAAVEEVFAASQEVKVARSAMNRADDRHDKAVAHARLCREKMVLLAGHPAEWRGREFL